MACCTSPQWTYPSAWTARQPPDEGLHRQDRWTEEAISPHCPFIGALFVSLLNYPLSYDPVGWGVPYGSLIVNVRPPPPCLSVHAPLHLAHRIAALLCAGLR